MTIRILARPAYTSLKFNPYTSLIYREVAKAGVRVVEYDPFRAPFRQCDVIHVHWPESVFDHTLAEALPTTESLLFAIDRLRSRGAKLLWTIHNLRAHEHKHTQLEERFWNRFTSRLDGVVALTNPGLSAARARFGFSHVPAWIVPHPHYRGQYPDTLDRRQARQRLNLPESAKVLLTFGRMYEYKNVPALIRAVRAARSENWIVIVAGNPRNAAIAEDFRREAGDDERIQLHLRYIPSDEAQVYFRASDLVVEPYREILNSGTALLALSFDRPVLVPHRGAGVDLSRDFGEPWVYTFHSTLTAEALARTLRAVEGLPEHTDGSHIASIDVARVGERMVRVYRELVCQ